MSGCDCQRANFGSTEGQNHHQYIFWDDTPDSLGKKGSVFRKWIKESLGMLFGTHLIIVILGVTHTINYMLSAIPSIPTVSPSLPPFFLLSSINWTIKKYCTSSKTQLSEGVPVSAPLSCNAGGMDRMPGSPWQQTAQVSRWVCPSRGTQKHTNQVILHLLQHRVHVLSG